MMPHLENIALSLTLLVLLPAMIAYAVVPHGSVVHLLGPYPEEFEELIL